MSNNPLKIVAVSDKPSPLKKTKNTKDEAQARMERLWLRNPNHFNSNKNGMERERIARTWHLIISSITLYESKCADLGFGAGAITEELLKSEAVVDSVDIASQPIQRLKETNEIIKGKLTLFQDQVPFTKLKDNSYDLVVSTDLIAYLPKEHHRLYFSELARLVKPNGLVVCSTPLDINSEDAANRFAAFAQTEFNVHTWTYSFHLLTIRLKDFFEAPKRFIRGFDDPEYLNRQLNQKNKFGQKWIKFNSSYLMTRFWMLVSLLFNPIADMIIQNKWIILKLEQLCYFIWSDQGVSHVIFVGTKKPIDPPKAEITQTPCRKTKKVIWE